MRDIGTSRDLSVQKIIMYRFVATGKIMVNDCWKSLAFLVVFLYSESDNPFDQFIRNVIKRKSNGAFSLFVV